MFLHLHICAIFPFRLQGVSVCDTLYLSGKAPQPRKGESRKGLVQMTTYTHTLSGRSFTATDGESTYGAAAVDGHWDSGEAGTIWPAETLSDGRPLWV